jgi:hypothetical protein
MIYSVILHYDAGDVTLTALGIKNACLLAEVYEGECEVTVIPNVTEYLRGIDHHMVRRLKIIRGGHRG